MCLLRVFLGETGPDTHIHDRAADMSGGTLDRKINNFHCVSLFSYPHYTSA